MINYRVSGFVGGTEQLREALSTTLIVSGARLSELADGLPHLRIEPRVGNGLQITTTAATVAGYASTDVSVVSLRLASGGGLSFNGSGELQATGVGAGDVAGPASSTDNAVARFSELTGKVIQSSPVTIDDAGTINLPTGQTYQINGTNVLSATTLGSAVVSSSLTSLGTLAGLLVGNGTYPVPASGGASELTRIGGSVRVSGTIYAQDFVLTGGSSGTGLLLDHLDDVVITGLPSDGEVLRYDGVTQKWINAASSSAGYNRGSTAFDGAAELVTSTTTADQVVLGLALATYRSVKYQVQVKAGSAYQVTELLAVHDGSTTYLTEYAALFSGASLATFSVDLTGGNMRLLVTPTNAATTIKVAYTAMTV